MITYLKNMYHALRKKALIQSFLAVVGGAFLYAIYNVVADGNLDALFGALLVGLVFWLIIILMEAAYQSANMIVTGRKLASAAETERREKYLKTSQKLKILAMTVPTAIAVIVMVVTVVLSIAAILDWLGFIEF